MRNMKIRPIRRIKQTTRHSSNVPESRASGRIIPVALALILFTLQGCVSTPSAPHGQSASASKPTTAVTPQNQAELASAMALVKSEQYDKSIEAFKRLAGALPGNPIPLIDLALVYKKLDKLDLAEEHLKQALEIDPDNPVAGNELALLYRRKGRFKEARSIYEKVLEKYPHFAMGQRNLGILCDLYLRDYKCALVHYKLYKVEATDDKNIKIWIVDLKKRMDEQASQ